MTLRRNRRLVIVGGGLAGLAAATEATRAGLQTCVVEQQPTLRAEFANSNAEVMLETAVWGIWSRDLALCGPRLESSVMTFEQLIIATGSFERPVAFPGWTLPGVLSLSEALALLERGESPGARVVVAGYAAFVAPGVEALQRAGVQPVAVLDAAAPDGRLPIRAEGDARLERVVAARVPCTGTEETLEADALVLAYGSLPEDRLARLAGCDFSGSTYVDPETVRDEWMRTSVPGVQVAGDAGGVVGSEASIAQGRLAGLAAALDAGCINADEARRRARGLQDSRADRLEPPPMGLLALAEPDTVICRCEGITAAQITERIFDSNVDPAAVIAETRAGMGECQARKCASLIAAIIARHAGVPLERIPPITPRPPIVPVPLGAIAERPPTWM